MLCYKLALEVLYGSTKSGLAKDIVAFNLPHVHPRYAGLVLGGCAGELQLQCCCCKFQVGISASENDICDRRSGSVGGRVS